MATTYGSFTELAAAVVPAPVEKPVEEVKPPDTAFQRVYDAHGPIAADIFAAINGHETTKCSGHAGRIIYDIDFLRRHLRTDDIDTVREACCVLVGNGLARWTSGGNGLKAA